MKEESIKFEELNPGYTFQTMRISFNQGLVSKYLKVVKITKKTSDNIIYPESCPNNKITVYIPPTAILAMIMKALIESLAPPPGTIHVSQELEIFQALKIGETIFSEAKIAQKTKRGGLNIVVIDLLVKDLKGEQVMSGKTTLFLPE